MYVIRTLDWRQNLTYACCVSIVDTGYNIRLHIVWDIASFVAHMTGR